MFFLAKYGVETTIRFSVVKRGVVDLAAGADWTPASGDTKLSQDGGNVANSTNNPVVIGGTGSVTWRLALTATELQAAEVNVQIVDSATKAVEDQFLTVYTYGNASAKIPFDFSVATQGVDVVSISGSAAAAQALDRSARTIVRFTVDTGASATSIPTSSMDPAASMTDQFKNRVAVFDRDTTTAALRGQATDVTASTAGGTLTVGALTTAPASGDTGVIL